MHDSRNGLIFLVHGHDKGKLVLHVGISRKSSYSKTCFTASLNKDICWANQLIIKLILFRNE